jgi:hypothetical protein
MFRTIIPLSKSGICLEFVARTHSAVPTDKNGRFVKFMKEEMPTLAENSQMLDQLFSAFGESRSGYINEQELILGLTTLNTGSAAEKLKLCFQTANCGHDGKISGGCCHGIHHAPISFGTTVFFYLPACLPACLHVVI